MIPLSPRQSRGKIGAAALVRPPGRDMARDRLRQRAAIFSLQATGVEESGECVSYFT
jgi:hypothetical protein